MRYLFVANLLKGAGALALFVLCCVPAGAQKADSKKISDLFVEIREHASLAEDDAQTLESFTRSVSIGWESHAHQLNFVKQHVNDLMKDYKEMERVREDGSPWQQNAIDQLRPVLKDMADHLNTMIQQQREHPTQVKMQPWVDCVHANSEYILKASSLIHDLVDYGASKSTADSLEHQLQLPSRAETN